MIRDLSEGEKGLLPLLIVRSKVGIDCQERVAIWGGPDIKSDMNL
jgi:hypothetical protein